MGKNFGRLLRKYRKDRRITQWELYGQLGEYGYDKERGGSIVSRWETGERNPPYETVLALERVLRVTDGSLLDAAGYRSAKPSSGTLESPLGLTDERRPEREEAKIPVQIRLDYHQERLLGLIRSWTEELGAPVCEFTMTDLGGPGVHGGEHGLVWENADDGVRRRLPLTVDTSAEDSLLWECLCQHLRTGGYYWLLGRLDEWERVGGRELTKRAALLKKINDMLTEKCSSVRGDRGEATPYFGGTLMAALIDGLTLKYSFSGEPGVPQYTTFCAHLPIGLASTQGPGHAFQEYHKALVTALNGHRLTESVRGLASKRSEIASDIERGLSEMLIQGYVPGSCRYCPPRA